jgi:hypothetical protein
MVTRTLDGSPTFRCYTRALKNARYLQQVAPRLFARGPEAEGFGTGVAVEILRGLHRIGHDSPALSRLEDVADFLRTSRLPVPAGQVGGARFSGTVHFAQVTFQTSGGNRVIPTAAMQQIVQYAQHAIVPISKYAAQYGPNTVRISPTLLTFTAGPKNLYSYQDVQGWVNQMVAASGLPSASSCIFVVSPPGVMIEGVGGNSGYHLKADVPYAVAGVFASELTLADNPDVYAMAVSHELAEMIVDPNANPAMPEVCDVCDGSCNNLTRCYFDASDKYLGSNQASPASGFPFSYYTCAVVRPARAAGHCLASYADCGYAPV